MSRRLTTAALLATGVTLGGAAAAQATAPLGSNGKLAYSLFAGGQSDLFTINPDGTGKAPVTNTASPVSEVEPSWSPTGARIAFTFCVSNSCDIAVINPDGGGLLDLTNTPGTAQEQRPAFSSDGRLVAFDRSDSTGDRSIWVMNSDGTNQRPLTHTSSPNFDFTPDFAPDGNTITYTHCVSGTPGQCDVWAMNSDGTNQRNLTNTPAPNSELAGSFSPNGAQIVFQMDVGNNSDDDLAIMNADGSGRRVLVDTTPAGERRPVFSGDGTRLAFSFADGVTPQFDIYTSDMSAQNQFNVTNTLGPGETEATPDWESVQSCGGKRATIVGDNGSEVLRGTGGRDVIVANGGADTVKGKGGKDLICGGAGKDKLNGGKGDDKLFGGAAKDTLKGGGGNDKLVGGKGKDTCAGAKGKDKGKGCEKLKGVEVGAIAKFK